MIVFCEFEMKRPSIRASHFAGSIYSQFCYSEYGSLAVLPCLKGENKLVRERESSSPSHLGKGTVKNLILSFGNDLMKQQLYIKAVFKDNIWSSQIKKKI